MFISRLERQLLHKKTTAASSQDIIGKIKDLPTLPLVAVRVMEIINDPHSSASDLADIISSDPAMAAKVLRLVNSAYYGFPNPITTITHAVAIMGFNTLRSLVLSVATFDLFAKRRGESAFQPEDIWLHSIATAVGSKLLAKRLGLPNFEELFITGLLHDVGKVILDLYTHQDFMKCIATAQRTAKPLWFVEQEILGSSHAEVGQCVAVKWRLPAVLTESIRWHHEVMKAKDYARAAAIVNVADTFVKACGIGKSGDYIRTPIQPEVTALLSLEKIDLNAFQTELERGVKECEAFLQIDKLGVAKEDDSGKGKSA